MELQVIIGQKRGVIEITSEQFIIEDLKAYICSKMDLEQSEYKVKFKCDSSPSLELISVSTSTNFSFRDNQAPLLDIDSSKSCDKVAKYLENEIMKIDKKISFVTIRDEGYSSKTTPTISVFFKQAEWDSSSKALTYFGAKINNYNKPLHREITNEQRERIYNIIKPYLI